MQIRRIKEINNIGTFANFSNGGSTGFEKLTFIYGLNTFGKTTLADIFQSLKTNDNTIISNRETIPEIASPQKVNLSVRKYGENEADITFAGGAWTENEVSPYLEVFGSDFIHNNVFTGLTIERKNKENLTNFILGDQGVQLAEKIRIKKKALGEKKRVLKENIPQYVKTSTEDEINKFIEYNIANLDSEKIDQELTHNKLLLHKEQERLKEPTKITNLPEPNVFTPQVNNLSETINTINTLLEKNYNDIKAESIEKLNMHVSNNFTDSDSSKNWIYQGLNLCKNKHEGNCPFCGQELKNAKDLIDLYSTYFDKAFTDFVNEITSGLKINIGLLKNNRLVSRSLLQSALLNINKYKELIQDENFLENLSQLEQKTAELKEEQIEEEKNRIIALLENKIEEKNKIPYEKIDPLDYRHINDMVNEYSEILIECIKLIEYFINEIKLFKKQYQNTATIEKTIKSLSQIILELEYKKARIEQNSECQLFKKISGDLDKLENGDDGVKKLEEKLQQDQTKLLEKYFATINDLFAKFGSTNFTLERNEDNKGHMPVYSLAVKFHGKEIPVDKLCTVFSESDRRALALAIFFARFELKEEMNKRKTIIILDDPVTSFDDNRTTNSINYFKKILSENSQLIILTHYLHFIKRFCEITKKQQASPIFININQNNFTSYLELVNRDEIISTDYDKTFMKIYGYINRSHSDSIKTDLRPFLENMYFPIVFCKQIQDKQVNCCDLKNIIDGLFENDEIIKNKFHEFRTTLNPDSHLFTNNNEEDVRNFAKDMFEFIYSLEFTRDN
ncbi:AAA family ATPase [Candidatus Parcubacteria bacterium]|nr:AAA family ATPase [Candidatus Parcubacteria bacterium]